MFRRLSLLLLAPALVLAACGTTESSSGGSPTTDPPTGAAITLKDGRGKTITLKGPATRVVALEWMQAENLVTLGVMPVGVADTKGYATWNRVAPLDASVKDVGTRAEPSADAVTNLRPDLVIVDRDLPDGAIELIERHAPVLVISGSDASDNLAKMRSNFELIARATGTEATAKTVLADFDAKIATAKKTLASAGHAGERFALADGYLVGGTLTVRMFAKGSLMSDTIEAIGLENAWPGAGDKVWGLDETDVEGLLKLDDPHFFYSASTEDPFTLGLDKNPIWRSLSFVQSGRIHGLEKGTWTFGGPAATGFVIDQVVAAVTG